MHTPPPHEGPSKHDLARINEIVGGYGDWFSAKLIRLIAHADTGNRERLRVMFPNHVRAFEDWVSPKEEVDG